MKKKILFTIFIAFLSLGMFAATISVNPSTPNIQAVINGSTAGDIIEFDDGTYALSACLIVNKGITLISKNGVSSTIIDGGYTIPGTGVRCFHLSHADAVVDGFTIQKAFGNFTDKHGGGLRLANGATVQNCIIQYNQGQDGGGVAIDATGGYVLNCIIRNNTAVWGGGVRLFGGEVRNCLITDNTSIGSGHGGGVNIYTAGNVYNCTVVNNTSPDCGGIRTWNTSNVGNNIVYNNSAPNIRSTGASDNHFNNFTSDPSFVGANDFHLQLGSPCIDAGINAAWMTTAYDLDGNTRIYNSIVDKGCYEYFPAIIDDDGDGIENIDDDFPDDPDRAFINHFPAAGFGSLAFEDLWPGKGDYDFNDVVVDYRFATVTNAQDYVVDVTATIVAKASGAYFHNGFGFELTEADNGLKTDLVVTGYDLQESYITVDGNGLEENQSHPTIIVFDDIFNSLPHPQLGLGVNTEDWTPFVPFDTLTVIMTPVQDTYIANDFNLVDWNPFIIVDMDRDVEVHLKDKAPTDLADPSIFGTVEDDSDPGTGRYYVTANNLPWAIDVPSSFDWPKEKVDIAWTYYHFIEWAQSLGVDYDDWYEDNPGYRYNPNIYQVP